MLMVTILLEELTTACNSGIDSSNSSTNRGGGGGGRDRGCNYNRSESCRDTSSLV